RSTYRLRSLLVTARGLQALAPELTTVDAPVYLAPEALVHGVCGFPFHRGALATADCGVPADPEALVAGCDRLMVIEGVNDHENVGALFRNAAAFGVEAVLLDPTAADPLYRRSIRVSMGHALRLPFARFREWPLGLHALRDRGFEVLALTPSLEADSLTSVGGRPRQALLVGAEGSGLSAGALAGADRRVRIALAREVDSVNVATAAAIALHHLARG
ncbi:MAG: TrmH family RNA methyltransferase, partial [Acidimicrobiia bacterium]